MLYFHSSKASDAPHDAGPDEVCAMLAARLGVPFISEVLDPTHLEWTMRDPAALEVPPVIRYRERDGVLKLLVAPSDDQIQAIEDVLSGRDDALSRILVTTPARLRQALLSKSAVAIANGACTALQMANPAMSARRTMTEPQKAVLTAISLCALAWFFAAPDSFLNAVHVLFSLFFLSCAILRLLAARIPTPSPAHVTSSQDDSSLPAYSVLVACYREASMAEQIFSAMSALDWPADRLEIKLVCEEDDLDTIEAFLALNLPAQFEILAVPVRGPRTKPKALNFALACCSGDYVVIYDAEDRPHPRQLREAWTVFSNASDDLACLQAPLGITNGGAGWLARMFAFEYAALFNGLLPYLSGREYLLPLGGTSNHFRRSALVAIGGWDPYNVTEDADLGVRLRRLGYSARTLTLPTLEEAQEDFVSWRNQRTRWFKGWIQTWFVHMRSPRTLFRSLGGKDFIIFQVLFAGHIGSALVHPVMFVLVFWQLVGSLVSGNSSAFSQALAAIDIGSVLLGYLAFAALADRVEYRGKRWSRLVMIASLPVYWTLQAIAALVACRQFRTEPHRWDKTPHKPVVSIRTQPKA